jgi:hypothetical protein
MENANEQIKKGVTQKRGHPLKGTGQVKKDLQYKKIILLTLCGYRT